MQILRSLRIIVIMDYCIFKASKFSFYNFKKNAQNVNEFVIFLNLLCLGKVLFTILVPMC